MLPEEINLAVSLPESIFQSMLSTNTKVYPIQTNEVPPLLTSRKETVPGSFNITGLCHYQSWQRERYRKDESSGTELHFKWKYPSLYIFNQSVRGVSEYLQTIFQRFDHWIRRHQNETFSTKIHTLADVRQYLQTETCTLCWSRRESRRGIILRAFLNGIPNSKYMLSLFPTGFE